MVDYTLGEMMGKGGMGTVYRAYHEKSGRDVAIRCTQERLTHDDEVVERLLRAVGLAGKIDRLNAVWDFDAGRTDV